MEGRLLLLALQVESRQQVHDELGRRPDGEQQRVALQFDLENFSFSSYVSGEFHLRRRERWLRFRRRYRFLRQGPTSC